MATYQYVNDGRPDGAIFGHSASDLIAFHGATPTDQPAFISDQNIAALSVSGVVGFTSSTSLSSLVGKVNSILAILAEKGLMASS